MNTDLMGPFVKVLTDTNLIISTSSAEILAEYVKPSALEVWIPLITSAAAAFAAFMSFWASKKSVILSHNLFLNEINKEHSQILRWMNEEFTPQLPLSNKNKQTMCNFLEKLCGLYYTKVIKKEEFLAYQSDLTHPDFVEYAKAHFLEKKTFGYYVKWIDENKITEKDF